MVGHPFDSVSDSTQGGRWGKTVRVITLNLNIHRRGVARALTMKRTLARTPISRSMSPRVELQRHDNVAQLWTNAVAGQVANVNRRYSSLPCNFDNFITGYVNPRPRWSDKSAQLSLRISFSRSTNLPMCSQNYAFSQHFFSRNDRSLKIFPSNLSVILVVLSRKKLWIVNFFLLMKLFFFEYN